MKIGFYFNKKGVVFVSGIAVNQKRVQRCVLSEDELCEARKLLAPFHNKKFTLVKKPSGLRGHSVVFYDIHPDTLRSTLQVLKNTVGEKLYNALAAYEPATVSGDYATQFALQPHVLLMEKTFITAA